MSNPFRDALAAVEGNGWLDEAARSSLRAAEAKFFAQPAEPLLRVDLRGNKILGAYDTALVSMAVQNATAKLAHVIRDPKQERTQTRRSDRDEALLVPRAQLGRTIYFGFPTPPSIDLLTVDMFPDVRTPTLTETAVVELCSILPSSSDDDAALDALASQRTTVRSAVGDIANAVAEVAAGIGLELVIVGQEAVHSEVSVDQAGVMRDTLRETRTDRRTEQMIGRLDGIRTRRRIFYLELNTGEEISGAIGPEDPSLMQKIRENLDHFVEATVVSEQVETMSGRRGRTSYRLVGLEPAPGLFD